MSKSKSRKTAVVVPTPETEVETHVVETEVVSVPEQEAQIPEVVETEPVVTGDSDEETVEYDEAEAEAEEADEAESKVSTAIVPKKRRSPDEILLAQSDKSDKRIQGYAAYEAEQQKIAQESMEYSNDETLQWYPNSRNPVGKLAEPVDGMPDSVRAKAIELAAAIGAESFRFMEVEVGYTVPDLHFPPDAVHLANHVQGVVGGHVYDVDGNERDASPLKDGEWAVTYFKHADAHEYGLVDIRQASANVTAPKWSLTNGEWNPGVVALSVDAQMSYDIGVETLAQMDIRRQAFIEAEAETIKALKAKQELRDIEKAQADLYKKNMEGLSTLYAGKQIKGADDKRLSWTALVDRAIKATITDGKKPDDWRALVIKDLRKQIESAEAYVAPEKKASEPKTGMTKNALAALEALLEATPGISPEQKKLLLDAAKAKAEASKKTEPKTATVADVETPKTDHKVMDPTAKLTSRKEAVEAARNSKNGNE